MIALCVLGSEPSSETPAAAPGAPERVLQVQADELWSSSGKVLKDAVLVVVDGRVRSVGSATDVDPARPLVRHHGVLTAGLIACGTQGGTHGELQDDTRSVLPRARAEYAFDPASHDFRRALAAGITAVEITPGPGNLVGGLACVVKTASGRVAARDCALSINLSGSALGRSISSGGFAFGVASEDPLAASNGGPETTSRSSRGTRAPTSYAGALVMLDELLAQAQGPFARVKRGDLPVTIEAWERHEVLRAAEFATRNALKGSLRGAPLAGDPQVVAALKQSGLGVVLGPYAADQTARSLESLARLSEAGIPVAFALDAPANAPDALRLSAARALRAGASRESVWRSLTEDAARLAGVAETTGRLAAGLEADFVLWSGDPLDLSSRVVAVYVDGERAWTEPH